MYNIVFLALKNPVLNSFNFLSNRELLSYKPLFYKKKRVNFQYLNELLSSYLYPHPDVITVCGLLFIMKHHNEFDK